MKMFFTATCLLIIAGLAPSRVLAEDAGLEDAQSAIEDVRQFDAASSDSQIEDAATGDDARQADDAASTILDAGLNDLAATNDAALIADAHNGDLDMPDVEVADSASQDVSSRDSALVDAATNDLGHIDVGQFDVPLNDANAGDAAPCVPGCVNESTLNSCSPTGALVILTCPTNSLCQVDRCVIQAEQSQDVSSCSAQANPGLPGLLLGLCAAIALLWRRRRKVQA